MSVDISQSFKDSILDQLLEIYKLKVIDWSTVSENIYSITCSFEDKTMKLKLNFSDFLTVGKTYFYIYFDGLYENFLNFNYLYSAIKDFNVEFNNFIATSNKFNLHNGNLFLLLEGYAVTESDLYHLFQFSNHTENAIFRLHSSSKFENIFIDVEINWHSFNIMVAHKSTGLLFKDSFKIDAMSYDKIKNYLLKIHLLEIIFSHNLKNELSIADIEDISFQNCDKLENFLSLISFIKI